MRIAVISDIRSNHYAYISNMKRLSTLEYKAIEVEEIRKMIVL